MLVLKSIQWLVRIKQKARYIIFRPIQRTFEGRYLQRNSSALSFCFKPNLTITINTLRYRSKLQIPQLFVSSCWVCGLPVSYSYSIKSPDETHNARQPIEDRTSHRFFPWNSSQLHSSPTPTQSRPACIYTGEDAFYGRADAGRPCCSAERPVIWLWRMRILTTGSKEVSGRVETVSITLRLFGGCRLLCSTFHRLCCSVDDDSSSLGALLYTDRLSWQR